MDLGEYTLGMVLGPKWSASDQNLNIGPHEHGSYLTIKNVLSEVRLFIRQNITPQIPAFLHEWTHVGGCG